MGTGEVAVMSEDQTLLLSNSEIFSINLRMEPAAVDVLLNRKWRCRDGPISNLNRLIEEFITLKGVRSMRILIGGAPCSGKTRLANELSSYYDVPVIDFDGTVVEAIECGGNEEWGALATAGEGNTKMYPAWKDITPDQQIEMLKWKMETNSSRYRGWIIDDWPPTTSLAEQLFTKAVKGAEVVPDAPLPELVDHLAPTKILIIDAEDDVLKERWAKLDKMALGHAYQTEESYLAAITTWRELQAGKVPEPVAPAKGAKGAPPPVAVVEIAWRDLFDKLVPERIVVCGPGEWPDTSHTVRQLFGEPTNFAGPGYLISSDWVPPVDVVVVDEPSEVPPQIAEVRRRKAQAMSKEALAVGDEMKENQTLYDQAAPLRHHLLKTVMPAVTESIVLVCEDQPDDPVDFIRKFLYTFEERENNTGIARQREMLAKEKEKRENVKAAQEKAQRESGGKKN